MPLNLGAGYFIDRVLQYPIFKDHYKQEGVYWC